MDAVSTFASTLLADDEPPPFMVEQAAGTSPFFLLCEHAASRLPRKLGDLGLEADELSRHTYAVE